MALPALTLNYLGQGALVLGNPAAIENPFFLMFPGWALWPVVLLTTVATVIASQAVITGAYSVTRQAIQLGLLPRFGIRHTSEEMAGQIYLPRVNWLLLLAVLLLVVVFKSSSALAAAYGVAVTATMITTSLMAFFVFWKLWQWPAVAGRRSDRAAAADRAGVLRGQRHQDLRRRVGAAGDRHCAHARHADLGQRHGHPQCWLPASRTPRSTGW